MTKKSEIEKKAKARKKAKAAVIRESGPAHNGTSLSDADRRAAFVQHFHRWSALDAKKKALATQFKELTRAAKADGYSMAEIKIAAMLLQSDNGEDLVRDEITARLRVSYWLKLPLGSQLEMFANTGMPKQDPFEQGKHDVVTDKPAKPQDYGYAPGSEEFEKYMAGFHEQTRELAGGIKASKAAEDSNIVHLGSRPAG
jgi:hypothetical protein